MGHVQRGGSPTAIDRTLASRMGAAAEHALQRGMKDIFAFDVAVTAQPGECRYLALECNPRFNGASYPTLVARKLGIERWSYETFTTEFRNLGEIDLEGIEYEAQSGTGVILLNWGPVILGNLGILLAGPVEKQKLLKNKLRKRLRKNHYK